MRETDVGVEEFVAYLNVVADRYPCGIPRGLLEEGSSTPHDRLVESANPKNLASPKSSREKNIEQRSSDDDPQPFECLAVWGGRESGLVFVGRGEGGVDARFSEVEQSLLDAAVTKGMNLSTAEVRFVAVHEPVHERGGPEKIERELKEVLTHSRARVVILLGEAVAKQCRAVCEGVAYEVVVTHQVSQVLADRSVKRAFWNDLQKAMEYLSR